MRSGILFMLFFLLTLVLQAQVIDTTVVADLDSALMEYDTTTYADYEEYDTAYASSTYTLRPGELSATQQEKETKYSERKFSKTEWKKIVGATNYTEDKIEEKKDSAKIERHERSSAWNPNTLKIIGYVFVLILIAAVIFLLLRSALLDNTVVKNARDGDTLLFDKHIDEVTENDLDRLLREALERNDLRSAIRLYYIKLLKHLHTTGYIAWKKDKTNHDYEAELSSVSFIRDFRRLVTAYEIIWYGERTPSVDEFKRLQLNFDNLHNQASRYEK